MAALIASLSKQRANRAAKQTGRRQGHTTKEFQQVFEQDRRDHEGVLEMNVPGNVLWHGRGNCEGAHIVPDRMAGAAFSQMLCAVKTKFLPLLQTQQAPAVTTTAVTDKMAVEEGKTLQQSSSGEEGPVALTFKDR